MSEKQYKLRILPLFENDLNEIVDYIIYRLKNPIAAENLIDAVETAIYDRMPDAESYEPYHCAKDRKHPYYQIPVKNFTIFYVVIDDVVEVRRIMYNKRNWKRTI